MASKTGAQGRGGVRAYQQNPPAGEGTGGSAPSAPPPGSGLPGAPGTGGGGPPAPGTGQQPPAPAVIPVDVLPPELRTKSEAEVRMTLTGIVDSLREANRRNASLQEELKRKDRTPSLPPSPEPAKPKSTKPLSDRLLEEPEAALEEFFQERAGPTLQRLQEIQTRLGSAETDLIRSKVPDFDEHAEDIERILGDGPRTQENLMGAYTMALGLKTLEERQRAARSSLNSDTPRDEPPLTTPVYQKTALSEEIRIGLGMGEDDYYNKYANSSVYDLVKVPR